VTDPHVSRAALLLEQSRYDLAEAELRLALAEDPDNGRLHSFLALCLAERGALDEAQAEADRGVALEPDAPSAHFMRAQILRKRKRLDEAMEAVAECLRLDPEQPSPRALRASIHLERKRWTEALEEAEIGLSFDPSDADCGNMRAIALTQLGRRAEAASSLGEALERDPENDVTHANRGWGLLHEGDPRKAMEHFREALRLDPTNEWARAGIVEALKARNPIYGLMLKYFLWMGRLSGKAQWGIVLGGFFGYQILVGQARRHPEAQPYLLPLLIGYALFALFSWIASPLFNMFLRLHPMGRHALSPDQKRAGTWVGAFFFLTLGALAWALGGGDAAPELTLRLALFLMPLSAVFACAPGTYRRVMAFAAAALFAVLVAPFVPGVEAGGSLESAYFPCVLVASILGNGLAVASRR
jgi:tetratricopeptide (TPR) repeat protein